MSDPQAIQFRDRYIDAIRTTYRSRGYLVIAWPIDKPLPMPGDVVNDLVISQGVLDITLEPMRVTGPAQETEFYDQVTAIRQSVGLQVHALGLTRKHFFRAVKVKR